MQTSRKARFANGEFQRDEEMVKPECSGLASFDYSDGRVIRRNEGTRDCSLLPTCGDIGTVETDRLIVTVENWLWRIQSEESTVVPFFEIEDIPHAKFKICTKLTEYGGIAVVFRVRTIGGLPCSTTLMVTASVLTPAREELYVSSKTVAPIKWESVTYLTLFNPYAGDEECLRHDDLKIRIRIAKVVEKSQEGSFPIETTQVDNGMDTTFHIIESTRISDYNLELPKRDRWTDLTLVTDDGVSFPVHRCILATMSPFFLVMMTTDMAEKGNKEIYLKEVSSDVLEALLELVYSGSLPKDLSVPAAVELYALADRYLMPYLYQICLDYIEEEMRPSNVTSVLPLLHFHWDKSLGNSAMELVAENAGKVLKSDSWKEAKEHFPELCNKFLDFAARKKTRFGNGKEKKAKAENKVQKKDFLLAAGQALKSAMCSLFQIAISKIAYSIFAK